MSLGYASACLRDEWAIFNNPGGLTGVTKPTASFSYDSYPAMSSFNRMAACFAMTVGPGVAGLGIYRYGDDLYNEQVLSAGYAHAVGIASLGLKVNYIQYHAQGFGNANTLTVSFGGIAQLTPQLAIGAHIININQPKLAKVNEESLPTILLVGIGFTLSEKVFLTSEVEKDLAYDIMFKSGLEYKIHKKVSVRTGFAFEPKSGFAGFGWDTGKFNLHYAFQYNINVGANHQATVAYTFKANK